MTEKAIRALELDRQAESDLKALEQCFSHCPGCGRGGRAFRENCRGTSVACEILRVEIEQERGALRHRIRQLETERGDFRRREEQLRATSKRIEEQRDSLHGKLQGEMQQGRAKSSEAAAKALSKTAVAIGGASLAICLSAWRAVIEQKRREILEAYRAEKKLSDQKRFQGTLCALELSSTKNTKHHVFVAWASCLVESKCQRAASRQERKRWQSIAKRALVGFVNLETRARLVEALGCWRVCFYRHRVENGNIAKKRRDQQGKEQFDRAMGVWSESSNVFYLRCCFAGWTWGKSDSKLRGAEKERRSQIAKQAMAKFLMSEQMGCMVTCFIGWREILELSRMAAKSDALDEQARKAAAQQQRQYQRALDSWANSGNRLLRTQCFSDWLDFTIQSKEKNKHGKDERARRQAVALKAFAKMCANEAASTLQVCVIAWASILQDKRTSAILAEKQRLESMQQQQYERALGCWAQSSNKILQQSSWAAWATIVKDAKREKEAAVAERTARSEVARKALAKFLSAESEAIVRLVFDAWGKQLETKRGEAIEDDRRRMKALEAKQFEKAVGCMAQSSGRVLRRSAFLAWQEVLQETKEIALEKAKRSGIAMKALTKFILADVESLSRACLGSWKQSIEDRRKEIIEAERAKMLQAQQKQFQHALGCLANKNEKVLRQSCFVAWSEVVAETKRELQLKAEKSAAAMKTFAKMISSQGDHAQSVAFRAWDGFLQGVRREQIEFERARRESIQAKQFASALGCLAQSSERTIRRSAFVSWVETMELEKKEQSERAKKSEAAMKALAKMCAAQGDSLAWICIGGWKDILDQSRRDAIEADRNKMKGLQAKQFESALKALANTSDRTLTMTCFFDWRENVKEARRCAEEEMKEKAQKSASAMQSLIQMCASDSAACLRIHFSCWRDVLAVIRMERLNAEREKMEAKQLQKLEGTLGAIARSSDKGTKGSVLLAWSRVVQAEKDLLESQTQEKLKQAAVAMQALLKMTQSNDAATVRLSLNAWKDLMQMKIFEAIEVERQRLASAKAHQFEGALRCMAQSSDRAAKSGTFTMWRDAVAEERARKQAEMEQKARKSQAAAQAVAQVCAADGTALARLCLGKWAEIAEQTRKEKIHAEWQRRKNTQLAAYERSMMSLAQNNTDVMLRSICSSWHLFAKEARDAREAELREKAKKAETAMKALASICNNSALANMHMTWAAWFSVVEERRKDKIEEEMRKMKSMHLQQAERALSSLAASSESALVKGTFSSWQGVVADAKRIRELEFQEKTKRSEVAIRSLAKFCQSNDNQSMQMCVAGWRAVIEDNRRAAIQAERERLLQVQSKQFEKTAAQFANSSDRGLKGTTFAAWGEVVRKMKEKLAIEREEKTKRSQVAMRSLAKFCSSQSQATLQICMSSWTQILEEKKREAVKAEAEKLRQTQKEQFNRAMSVWANSSQKTLRQSCFSKWYDIIREKRIRKELSSEQRSAQSASTQRAISKFLRSSSEGLLQMCFGSWRALIEENTRESMDQELQRLRLKKAELEKVAQDRVPRSAVGCRLGAKIRSWRSRLIILAWVGIATESKGRQLPLRVLNLQESTAFLKASKSTTVGALLAEAQAQVELRNFRKKRSSIDYGRGTRNQDEAA